MLDKFRERKLEEINNLAIKRKNTEYTDEEIEILYLAFISDLISEVERANTVTECNEALIAGTKLLYFKKGLKSQAIRFEDNLNNPKV